MKYSDIMSLVRPTVVQRSKFTYNGGATAYTVKVGAGCYYVKGKLAKWVSELTTGAIGTPAATTRYYLYLDYSAITSGTPITATELIWSDTAPTYSHTYGGLYNGDDLCIFGVFTGAGPANILEFFHDGGDYVLWANGFLETSSLAPSTTWTDLDMASSMPAFATKALCNFRLTYIDASVTAYWRTNGQAGTAGHRIGTVVVDVANYESVSEIIITDSAQIIEFKYDGATTNQIIVTVQGWFFPGGM